jgi:hypothetical protein
LVNILNVVHLRDSNSDVLIINLGLLCDDGAHADIGECVRLSIGVEVTQLPWRNHPKHAVHFARLLTLSDWQLCHHVRSVFLEAQVQVGNEVVLLDLEFHLRPSLTYPAV